MTIIDVKERTENLINQLLDRGVGRFGKSYTSIFIK